MPRLLIPILALATVALPAAEGKGRHHELGQLLARQVVDAGHILEIRAVQGSSGQILVRWGDLDKAVGKGGGRFDWSGSASGDSVSLVRTMAFESGKDDKPKAKAIDRVVDSGSGGGVSWSARTSSAWDGVVLQARSGSSVQIQAGPANLSVAVP
ncbi:MAG: hypothetical protein J0M02_10990 [Planctomycetes bacterium]|nr:hypothetical protein [Planctomycetota bacterium]